MHISAFFERRLFYSAGVNLELHLLCLNLSVVTLKSFNGHFHLFPIVRLAIKQDLLEFYYKH